ncbi:putative endoglucanase type K [Lachnellula hyalina]|uniref:Cellulase n=1 Tax=Lachnellula hyalina TaxID=1316788 RepID=A0A8H8QT77_9HELO|nr:putative endoglucanase type K [Lachnellula hyalina]TVY22363.1 putative endoglucanase type K [Lachnellula hyalina]
MMLPRTTLLALLPFFIKVNSQSSGTGTTTRYWDCCKASCGWSGKATLASGSNPVTSCDAQDNPLTNYDAASGCNSGTSYMCSDQSPWAVSDTLSYGFAATTISGGSEASWCCACYELTFTSGAVQGKKMIVQATNTGGDLGANQFDLAIPGGGFGLFNGCTAEWGTPSTGWGQQYGGISARADCDAFPDKLKAACYWRFDWFGNSDNPGVTFEQVACPAALTAKSGCVRESDAIDETPTGASSVSTWTSGAAAVAATSPVAQVVAVSSSSSSSSSSIVAASTTAAATSAVASSGETVPQYGKCGGDGYTGSTECAAGFTCKWSNAYYSQCL